MVGWSNSSQTESFLLAVKKMKPLPGGKSLMELEKDNLSSLVVGVFM